METPPLWHATIYISQGSHLVFKTMVFQLIFVTLNVFFFSEKTQIALHVSSGKNKLENHILENQ